MNDTRSAAGTERPASARLEAFFGGGKYAKARRKARQTKYTEPKRDKYSAWRSDYDDAAVFAIPMDRNEQDGTIQKSSPSRGRAEQPHSRSGSRASKDTRLVAATSFSPPQSPGGGGKSTFVLPRSVPDFKQDGDLSPRSAQRVHRDNPPRPRTAPSEESAGLLKYLRSMDEAKKQSFLHELLSADPAAVQAAAALAGNGMTDTTSALPMEPAEIQTTDVFDAIVAAPPVRRTGPDDPKAFESPIPSPKSEPRRRPSGGIGAAHEDRNYGQESAPRLQKALERDGPGSSDGEENSDEEGGKRKSANGSGTRGGPAPDSPPGELGLLEPDPIGGRIPKVLGKKRRVYRTPLLTQYHCFIVAVVTSFISLGLFFLTLWVSSAST
ncbi:unnamed protein product [Amoebophrya sp. A120]|nr:unnamed protein product [Amoebophrya sp. A120]|eukprot:GSA120T00012772001.1